MSFFDWKPRWTGEKVDESRCRAAVHESGRGVGFYQCQRKPVEGGRYCKQHSPEGRQVQRERADAKYEAQQRAEAKQREQQAVHLLKSLGYTVVPPVSHGGKDET